MTRERPGCLLSGPRGPHSTGSPTSDTLTIINHVLQLSAGVFIDGTLGSISREGIGQLWAPPLYALTCCWQNPAQSPAVPERLGRWAGARGTAVVEHRFWDRLVRPGRSAMMLSTFAASAPAALTLVL